MAVRREYDGLQILRAIAALGVVAGHSTDYLVARNGSLPIGLAWIHGPAGVDIFFVISGFVMMISVGGLLGRDHPARNFLVRRLIRIVPLYWLLTAFKLVLVAWRPQLAEHALPSAWNAISSFLFIPSFGATGEIRPVIPVGWTLSFEMSFYLLFALGMAGSGKVLRFITPAILVVALLGILRTGAWPAWTAVADPIVLEFLAGVWVAKLTMEGRMLPRTVAAGAVLLGFVGIALQVPAGGAIVRPLTWGICATLIVAATVALEGDISGRIPKWLLLLGNASYSIYLIQVFVFPALHVLLSRFGPEMAEQHPFETGIGMIFASLIMVSIAGVVVHRAIESPINHRLRVAVGVAKPRPVPA